MPDAPSRLSQAGLAVLASAAAAALALVHGVAAAWALVAVAVVSILWRIHRAPPRAVAFAFSAVRVLAGAVVVLAVFVTLYPVLDETHVGRLGALVGTALLLPTALALLATPVLPPAIGAVPLSIALLAVASFHPLAPLGPWQALAAAGAVLYLGTGAQRAGVSFPGRRLVRVALLLAISVAVAVGVSMFLPWAQPKVEEMTASMLEPQQGQPGLSNMSRLGDIQSLALSRTVAMRVWGDPPRKLRGRVLTQFDGRTWRSPNPAWRAVPALETALLPADLATWLARMSGASFGDAEAAGRSGNGQMVIAPVGVGAGTLFAPAPTWAVRAPFDRLNRDAMGVFDPPYEMPPTYAVVHGPAGAAVSDEGDDAALLAVPRDLDPRVAELAARLGAGARSSDERLARTLDHLWSGYRYSLEMGRFQSRQPVAEFLFEKKQGWCEYFASAAVVLLRLQGVPARYVTGFSMDGARRVAGQYVVRESDAHAWIEAYVPGRGWIEADPTPASDYAAVHAELGGGALERVLDALRAAWSELALAVRLGDVRRLIVALRDLISRPLVALPLVLGLAVVLWRRRRARARPTLPVRGVDVDPELAALVERAESLWAACGQARPRHRAPLEHVETAGKHLPVPTRDATRAVVDCLYRARYAGVVVPAAEIRGLRERLDSLGG